MENMPWPKALGWPAAWAVTSSWCIGLKSPDAPAYFTRSVRVSLCETTGASSPTLTSSYVSFCSLIVSVPSLRPVDQVRPLCRHQLPGLLVRPSRLRHDEGH